MNMITWADNRAADIATSLRNSAHGPTLYEQNGTPIHAMAPLSKIIWLQQEAADIFGRTHKFISIKEYIWHKLFNCFEIDYSIASATGMFNITSLQWSSLALELAQIGEDRLSTPVNTDRIRRGMNTSVAELLNIPADTPMLIGSSDGCLANVGSFAVRRGDTALTIGTSGAIRMTTSTPESDPRERIFSYVLADGYYVCGGATNNGGNVLQWYSEQVLGRRGADATEVERLVAEADTVVAGCEGLVFLPYLLGERAPVWDAHAKGVFFGVRSIHDQRYFLRAILEGVSYSLRQIGASLEETIGPIDRIYASGGFSKSPIWLQLMADIFQKKVVVTGSADASAVGAAQLGFYALGVLPGLDAAASLVKVESVYEPDPGRAAVYEHNYGVFTELYSRLKDLM